MEMRRFVDRWQQRRWPRFTLARSLALSPPSLLLVTLARCFFNLSLRPIFFCFLFFLIFPPGLNVRWVLPEDERVA